MTMPPGGYRPNIGSRVAAVPVATTSTEVAGYNLKRRYLLIINVSDTDINLALGGAAVVGAGILIKAGGHFEMTRENLLPVEVYAIHGGAATKNVSIQEVSY